MAAASDKARFFLEQSVPELKEYERKQIFSAAEIQSIARKRSDFEHKINARGSTALDYVRYAEFEINVDTLKRKRIKRLGIKGTTHNGQRRIFFVFDRGTRKHSGDVGLWLQSIEFAQKHKAHKKLNQIFTTVLRLHPTRPELWIYAAQHAMDEEGDIMKARDYMQRGLRFNKNKRSMWLEYARLEMSYLAKIHARRQILGIADQENDGDLAAGLQDEESANQLTAVNLISGDHAEEKVENEPLRIATPAGTVGSKISMAVFDAAMVQFDHEPDLALSFFEVSAQLSEVPVAKDICQHVLGDLEKKKPNAWQLWACRIQLPLLSTSLSSPDYPAALRQTLTMIKDARSRLTRSSELDIWLRSWLGKLLVLEDLDGALKTVIGSALQSLGPSS